MLVITGSSMVQITCCEGFEKIPDRPRCYYYKEERVPDLEVDPCHLVSLATAVCNSHFLPLGPDRDIEQVAKMLRLWEAQAQKLTALQISLSVPYFLL